MVQIAKDQKLDSGSLDKQKQGIQYERHACCHQVTDKLTEVSKADYSMVDLMQSVIIGAHTSDLCCLGCTFRLMRIEHRQQSRAYMPLNREGVAKLYNLMFAKRGKRGIRVEKQKECRPR